MTDSLTFSMSTVQTDALRQFAEHVNRFDANIAFYALDNSLIFSSQAGKFHSDLDQLSSCARMISRQMYDKVYRFGPCDHILAISLKADNQIAAIAIIDIGRTEINDNEDLARLCSQHQIDYSIMANIIKAGRKDSDYIEHIMLTFANEFRNLSIDSQQIQQISTELSHTYEELVLLHRLTSKMKVNQPNSTYLQMACDQLAQIIEVGGVAIFVDKKIDGEKRLTLSAGMGFIPIDQSLAEKMMVLLDDEITAGRHALIDSNIESPFKYDWPDTIESVVAVPMEVNDKYIGFMVAVNIATKPGFDTGDVKLLDSVANQCAVFIENDSLFSDLKELFVGSLKALTNSIDAKDQYTRGHSERVAFISRWIAERLDLPSHQVHKIYLAGLLHDIGKIGVDEVVLRKKGVLTEEQFDQMKMHPRIGASILADIKQMEDIVKGVLTHHERIDGEGYPEGLSGDQIPIIGKIISLADCFDAMTSKRAYRDAMSVKRAEAEIEAGIGTQFDEKIARVFLDNDINELWEIIQDGFIETWDYSNFAEYGTVAVGALVR